MSDELESIVVDSGTCLCKAGFGGDEAPRAVFPTLVGRPRSQATGTSANYSGAYIGNEAQAKREVLNLSYPIKSGIITNWDDLERIWDYTFREELRADPTERRVLFTDPPLNVKVHREKMVQILFETFNVPAGFVANQAVLSLFSARCATGLVVESGSSFTHVVPICEGRPITFPANRLDYAGRNSTDYLNRLILKRHYWPTTPINECPIIRDMKEKLCFVSLDFEADMRRSETSRDFDKDYEPDNGRVIDVGNERFLCPEALFQPKLIGIDNLGLHEAIYDSIMKCDESIRDTLMANIVLSGGNTMFPGIADRLHKELAALFPRNKKIKIIASPERQYASWYGGSMLSTFPSMKRIWITKSEYEEYGPEIVHQKSIL